MLKDLLAAHKWQEADTETANLLSSYTGGVSSFSYEDLRTIDRLWIEHSNCLFGFSVQKAIYQRINDTYQQIGGTRDYMKEPWEEFAYQVGWYKNNEWIAQHCTFALTAPKGHLPVLGQWSESNDDWGGDKWYGLSLGVRSWYSEATGWHQDNISDGHHRYFSYLMSRLTACDINT
jgi:GUN4-like